MIIQLDTLIPLLLQHVLVCVYGNVHWEIQTHPVVFGESVTLFCNTSSAQAVCKQCSRRWYGAQNLKLLSFDGSLIDPSKYGTSGESNGFALEIKHFNEEDVNIPYSCTFGFFFDKKILQLNNDFEIQPTNETTDIVQFFGSGSIKIGVQFKKVYPLPRCTIFLNEDNLSSKLITEQHKVGIFYTVTLKFQHNLTPNHCKGKVQLVCTIGTRNITVATKNLANICTGDYNDEQSRLSTKDIEGIVGGVDNNKEQSKLSTTDIAGIVCGVASPFIVAFVLLAIRTVSRARRRREYI